MKGLSNLKPRIPMAPSTGPASLLEPEPSWGKGRGGRPWRRRRDAILARDNYLCQCSECKASGLLTPADEVDHVIPLSQGGEDTDANLVAINSEHHKLKTARESHAGARR